MMPLRQPAPRQYAFEAPLAFLIACLGVLLTWWLFYPGIATHDSIVVYDQSYAGNFGDWQPPLLGWMWTHLEPFVGYGPRALFLPTSVIFWASLFTMFLALRRSSRWPAWFMLAIGFLPPLLALLGVIWRDVIFAACWLLAFALVFVVVEAPRFWRLLAFAVAFVFFMIGFLIRPNALFAAAPILVYLISPRTFSWKRQILFGLPLIVALQVVSSLVNYGWLEARRESAIHSVLVFDLTGITHFADKNVFPIDDWTPEQVEKVKTICYEPTYWDAIWWPRCSFAMARINRDIPKGSKLFGSDTLRQAWQRAIIANPIPYVQHRLNYFNALMTAKMLVIFNQSQSGQHRFFFLKDKSFKTFESGIEWLNENTPLFRGWPWLLLSVLSFVAALFWSNGPSKAATLALTLSSIIYTATYVVFGVAAEYRYVYWTVLASLVAAGMVAAQWAADRRQPVQSL